jgi:hypothetical protein
MTGIDNIKTLTQEINATLYLISTTFTQQLRQYFLAFIFHKKFGDDGHLIFSNKGK